jgi:plasmid stabilization system protein ParE
MYTLVFSKLVGSDIDSSYTYIKEVLEAPWAAENLIVELIAKLQYIKETPFARPLVQEAYLASLRIRSIRVKNHVIYYNIHENTKTIQVIRFLYNKRDWMHILKESLLDEILE